MKSPHAIQLTLKLKCCTTTLDKNTNNESSKQTQMCVVTDSRRPIVVDDFSRLVFIIFTKRNIENVATMHTQDKHESVIVRLVKMSRCVEGI